jgi:hypothetical protein
VLAVALIVPYWINEILRAFAFRIIFGATGVINSTLMALGLTDQPIDFIRMDVALYAGLSYAYVLLMIFPLYNADREPGPEPDRGGARPGCPLVEDPHPRRHPLRQARHHVGLHHGVHAGGRRAGRPADPRRAVEPVVHPAHLPAASSRA